MNIRYRVTLTAEERSHLAALIQKGKVSARRIKRTQIGAVDRTPSLSALRKCASWAENRASSAYPFERLELLD